MLSTPTRCASLVTATLLTATAVAGGVTSAAASTTPPDGPGKPGHVVKKHLLVKKTATTTFTRTYNWTIDKSADRTKVFLWKGKKATVNYKVGVGLDKARPFTDVRTVSGKIFIKNPSHRHSAKITGVEDVVSPNISATATVRCGVTFPYRLKADHTLKCRYGPVALPDTQKRFNKAIVRTSHHSKVRGGVAFAKVRFGNPQKVDRCVFVRDSRAGFLGRVCVDRQPKVFKYALTIGPAHRTGPAHKCGKFWFKNVAAFKTADTHTVGADRWWVKVYVPCKRPPHPRP